MARRRVIVVGGGLAGLAAAARLRARGAAVTVLEGAPRFGGRAASERRSGFCIDQGPHLVSATDRHLAGLAAEAGLAKELLPLRPTRLVQLHGGSLRGLAEGADATAALGCPGVLVHQALRVRRLGRLEERFRALLDPAAPERARRLDDRSVADFVRLYLGRSALQAWVAPWLLEEAHADPEETSRVAFLLAVRARAVGDAGPLRGGAGRLVDALAAPDQDRTSARVQAVEPRGKGFVVHASGGAMEADAVVVAVPAPEALALAAPVLTTPERTFLAGVRYAPVLALAAALERPPLRHAARVRVPAREAGPLATVLVEPGGEPARAPAGGGLVWAMPRPAWSAAHLDGDPERLTVDLLGALQRLFPGAPSAVRFTVLRRHERGLPTQPVGSFRALAAFRRVQADRRAVGRRLYFAGDHLVAPRLEGAVVSGLRAAEEAAADLGLAPRSAA